MNLDILLALLGVAVILVVIAIITHGFYQLGLSAGIVAERERRQALEIAEERRIAQVFQRTTESEKWQTEIDA